MLDKLALGIIIGVLFTALAVLFCFVLIKLYIRKIKDYNKKDIEFQKTLNAVIIETQEQVLNNISQDLHDDAGQQLTTINFQLESLKLESAALQLQLEPLSESVGRLSRSIRDISHLLDNQLVTREDLLKSIENELERLLKSSRFTITQSISGHHQKVFTSSEKIFIYRIFQEAINNAYKHSGATLLHVSITTVPSFTMTISDNGKGLDPLATRQSVGLHNMRHRAENIGYHLDILSAPGQGTSVILSESNK